MSRPNIISTDDLLAELPTELLEEILDSLDLHSFIRLSQVCRHLYTISKNVKFLQNAEMSSKSVLYRALVKRDSFLITGPGGVGKSYILSKLYDAAVKKKLNIAMTAPTGIAALNLKCGRTIHSYSSLGLATISLADIRTYFYTRTGQYYKWSKIWRETDILVIDEISMVGASLFEKVELCARLARGVEIPFGGIQVILCGDFFQLPPVHDRFVFTSPIWQQMTLPVISLTAPVRHRNDMRWFHILNRIRIGAITPNDIKLIQKRITNLDIVDILSGEFGCMLVSTNKEAQSYNTIAFDGNPYEISFTSKCRDHIFDREYDPRLQICYQTIRRDVNPVFAIDRIKGKLHKLPESISFKHGALYVMTFNIDPSAGLVNGLMCRFHADEGPRGVMKTLKGRTLPDYVLDPIDREIHIQENRFLLRNQVPFCLGFSLTIHSAQGMTLSHVVVDCGENIFTSAQTYVALSRVESLKGLTLTNFDPDRIYANGEAQRFYREIEERR